MDSRESGFEKMESGINARAIDFAKFGRLFLNKGTWNGKQIISSEWVAESTKMAQAAGPANKDYYSLCADYSAFKSGNGYYKYLWWGFYRDEDNYDFSALGKYGQFIYVSPLKKLVIVRHGKDYGVDSWTDIFYSFASR
jgi:CubicO group peptidase (beta-lactamase class C family)